MHQIRIHGRGGQGVVTAAELIAIAAFKSGHIAQAFPAFGVERTGAPIEAYARIDDQEIKIREQISAPDILVVQDASLISAVNLLRGGNDKTITIINTGKSQEETVAALNEHGNGVTINANNVFVVDATKIALKHLGKNIVNTTILGAFAKATGLLSLESLKDAIREKFADKGEGVINKNIKTIEEAYQ